MTRMHIIVLTSHFASEKKGPANPEFHYAEIEVALMANMLNSALVEVHVLYETFGKDNCNRFRQRIMQGLKPYSPAAKLACIDVKHQPTYYGAWQLGFLRVLGIRSE